MRHLVASAVIVATVGCGLSGCSTFTALSQGQAPTAAEVQQDAINVCGFLPSAETASQLIQAATQTTGTATASTDAADTALAEQLAVLACKAAGAFATTATTTAPATTTTTTAKSLRRRLVAPGVALVGNVQVPVSGRFVR